MAETLRVTAFAMPGTTLTPRRWSDVFGAEPDQVLRQPAMPSVEGGLREEARWSIHHQPDRIDIVVSPEMPAAVPSDLLNIGDFEARTGPLLDAAENTFDPKATVQRLAFGAILFMPVETIREGFRAIQTIVPQLQRVPENATDLLFQLNVPIVIDEPVAQLLVNRLVKWQVAGIQLLGMVTGPGTSFQLTRTGVRPVVRLELDINTSPERAVAFPGDKLGALVRQLGDIAKKLAKSGGFP
jgi:hypothetical protein